MAWLDRINEKQTRRFIQELARQLDRQSKPSRRRAERLANDAGRFADRALRDAPRYVETAGKFGDRGLREASRFSHRHRHDLDRASALAGGVAGSIASLGHRHGSDLIETAQEVAEYGLHEGEELARAAAVQLSRAGRAIKADPVPAVVGLVGLALFASLVMGTGRGRSTRS